MTADFVVLALKPDPTLPHLTCLVLVNIDVLILVHVNVSVGRLSVRHLTQLLSYFTYFSFSCFFQVMAKSRRNNLCTLKLVV